MTEPGTATARRNNGTSRRDEPCGACGDAAVLCPAIASDPKKAGRRFIRCCVHCTHRGKVDVDYEDHHPEHVDYYGRPPHPYPAGDPNHDSTNDKEDSSSW